MFLSIGDFSRATHMTIKTLRHYHKIGLLEPADIDPHTGYRRYATGQIPAAQVIRRFRALDMPLEEIQAVLSADDLATRNARISAHLSRLEDALGRTQHAVNSLRDLLSPKAIETSSPIEHRVVPATGAAAIDDTVDANDAMAWALGALGELYACLSAQNIDPSGTAGGVFHDDFFTQHRGRMTIFVPCAQPVRDLGRVTSVEIPAAELAIIQHTGPHSEVDRSYGALATHVTRHALAVEGPLREYYLVNQRDTPDTSQWRTEICWPVFQTAA